MHTRPHSRRQGRLEAAAVGHNVRRLPGGGAAGFPRHPDPPCPPSGSLSRSHGQPLAGEPSVGVQETHQVLRRSPGKAALIYNGKFEFGAPITLWADFGYK